MAMIKLQCDQCGKRFKVDVKFAGRSVRCTECGKSIVIPEPPSARPASSSEPHPDALAEGAEALSTEVSGDTDLQLDDDLIRQASGIEHAESRGFDASSADDELLAENSSDSATAKPDPAALEKHNADDVPTLDEDPGVPSRRKLVIAVVIVLALLLAAGGYWFTRERGAVHAPAGPVAGSAVSPPAAGLQSQASPTAVEPSPAPFTVQSGIVVVPDAAMGAQVQVRVLEARVRSVEVYDAATGRTEKTPDQALALTVQITNLRKDQVLDYISWAGQSEGYQRDFGTLEDDRDRAYRRRMFGVGLPVGRLARGAIGPGRAVTDLLVFERPAENLQHLDLTLPGENVGELTPLVLRIPRDQIQWR